MRRKPEQREGGSRPRQLIPDEALTETVVDITWIQENLLEFRAVVLEHYALDGEGAVIADTLAPPHAHNPHKMWYLPLEQLLTLDEPEVQALVNKYDPGREMVVVLLKPQNRQRAYRVLLPPEFPGIH